MSDSSSITMPHSIRNDPRLYKDDVDIRFSRTLNSCKLPQIRYASPERLFERLTDLRFLSIDFLNTFLLTYRVFTDGVTVLEALKKVHYLPDTQNSNMISPIHDSMGSLEEIGNNKLDPGGSGLGVNLGVGLHGADALSDYDYTRRISTTSVMSDISDAHRESVVSTNSETTAMLNNLQQAQNYSNRNNQHWRLSHRRFEEEEHARERYMRQHNDRSVATVPSSITNNSNNGNNSCKVVMKFEPVLSPGGDQIPIPMPPPPSPEVLTAGRLSQHFRAFATERQTSSESSSGENSSENEGQSDIEEAPIGTLPVNFENSKLDVHSSHSSETLKAEPNSQPTSPTMLSSATSSATLVGSLDSNTCSPKLSPVRRSAPVPIPSTLASKNETTVNVSAGVPDSQQTVPTTPPITATVNSFVLPSFRPVSSSKRTPSSSLAAAAVVSVSTSSTVVSSSPPTGNTTTSTMAAAAVAAATVVSGTHQSTPTRSLITNTNQLTPAASNYLRVRGASGKRGSSDTESTGFGSALATPRSSIQTDSTAVSTRSSFQGADTPQMSPKAGVVVTSSRASTRRSSSASAASAFAVAVAGSSNPPDPGTQSCSYTCSARTSRKPSAVGPDPQLVARCKRESMISTAATMRVLNVLRHWISKHSQDFENDPKLMAITTEFLEELVHNTNLLPAEHKAASQLLQMITKEDHTKRIDLDVLLAAPVNPCKETIETLHALDIAEMMTYLDHKIFISIQSGEFLGQAWMKNEKTTKAPHILLMTRRFNEVSRLVASEIMRASDMQKRIEIIDKWTAVADMCRNFHNFNGVLQICAAFTNSSVFRLKKTWDRVSKPVKLSIDKLQSLVSTDGRFRNMREALHRCDPPCIPYLGMYLTDLSFIEEGTPNFTDERLLNFSKMRMIAHVIREIRHFQQTPYKIAIKTKAIEYLLDTSRHLGDEELYQLSLCLEPRLSRLGTRITPTSTSGSPFGGTSPSHYSSA